MKQSYPSFKRGEFDIEYNKLPKAEQEHFKDYLTYRQSRGLKSADKVNDVRRYLFHLRWIYEDNLNKLTLKELRTLLSIINTSKLSLNAKNHIKADLRNFLKYTFKDWSFRFENFDDVKFNGSKLNSEKITSQVIFKKDDIDKLIKHETSIFYKAFLLTQYEGGLRTIEARFLRWDKIRFDVDGDICEVSVYSPKTDQSRTIFLEKASQYLKLLKAEQENTNTKGLFVFHSKKNPNQPIDKHSISVWFRRLTKKVLGRQGWSYLLRHTRATELYLLARQNKISEDTAIKFMGHSKSMSQTYTHLESSDVKEMLKNQVYKIEDLPKEKKHELEKEIDELKKKNESLEQGIKGIYDLLKGINLEDLKKLKMRVVPT